MKPRFDNHLPAANPQLDHTATTNTTTDLLPKYQPARIQLMLKTKTTKEAFSSEMDSTSSEEPQSPTCMSERSNDEGSPRGSMEGGSEEAGS